MLHSALQTLGADLRALRKSRGLTLSDLADTLGRSVGWMSQVERDLSEPALEDMRQIARALDVPLSMIARRDAPHGEDGYVVRKNMRRPVGGHIPGLVEELLSPDLTDDFEMVHSTFQPHSSNGAGVTRPTQEVGYLLSGKLDLTIGDKSFTIEPGDSFRVRGETFTWSNPYDTAAVAIWVIAPPVY